MNKITLHRNTNYIEFISGMKTNGTECGERIEAIKEPDGWHLINQIQERYFCPLATLRIMLENATKIKQYTVEF